MNQNYQHQKRKFANIKEESKYKVECSTLNESNDKTFTNEFDYDLSLPMTMNKYYAPKATNKVRVLKLRKKQLIAIVIITIFYLTFFYKIVLKIKKI